MGQTVLMYLLCGALCLSALALWLHNKFQIPIKIEELLTGEPRRWYSYAEIHSYTKAFDTDLKIWLKIMIDENNVLCCAPKPIGPSKVEFPVPDSNICTYKWNSQGLTEEMIRLY